MELPQGTVTFLFTDIEGSTRLWDEYPEQMRIALARHDALLHEIIAAHRGYVFKTVGDAFCAVFATAPESIAAAVAIQQALYRETWEGMVPLRVRMALHTGIADQRNNDYFGPPLNRVARLLAIGHGGQTLVSSAAHALTHEQLPPNVTLQNRGEVRLRDLAHPENVFELLHPDLPALFPPLRSLENLPNNLPPSLTSFIGRENELEDINLAFTSTHLLTLTGSGGCGKTRLSLQIAADLLENYPDGVWFIELASLSDPTFVHQAVAGVVGVREVPGQAVLKTLVEAVKNKKMLLILDNCEHLVAACAVLADTLLRACPQVRILASSREALGIAGEATYRVPSLALPDPKRFAGRVSSPTLLLEYEAVRLFTERAVSFAPTFAITEANVHSVAQLCHRLDGIPLALELAAARVRAMPVEQIALRLNDRFRLLTGGSRTALPRQQTLAALIDWSYDLLSEHERLLLNRLSVFAGGWTLEAAEAICSDDRIESWEVLDLLTSLVDKSLVLYQERQGAGRFSLLETVRQYAREKLLLYGEDESGRVQHLEYFLQLAEWAETHFYGLEESIWLDRLESEYDNLRTALESSVNDEYRLRLAGALSRFWYVRGHFTEGRSWLEGGLARAVSVPKTVKAKALSGAGTMLWLLGDYTTSEAMHRESLALYRELGDTFWIAFCLNNIGVQLISQGLSEVAQELLLESLTLLRASGSSKMLSLPLNSLGEIERMRNQYAAARRYYEEGLHFARQEQNLQNQMYLISNLCRVEILEGNLTEVFPLILEGFSLGETLRDKSLLVHFVDICGGLYTRLGQWQQAIPLLEAVENFCVSTNYIMDPTDHKDHEWFRSLIRAQQGEDVLRELGTPGERMTLEEAVDFIRANPPLPQEQAPN